MEFSDHQVSSGRPVPIFLQGGKVIDSLPLSREEKITANFESFQKGGLANMEQKGLAKELFRVAGYVGFVMIRHTPTTPYEMMLCAFPEGSNPIVHTLDEMPVQLREVFWKNALKIRQTVLQVAKENNNQIKSSYMLMHVGPEEIDHDFSFRTSFPQAHMHIQAYGDWILDDHIFQIQDISKSKENGLKYLFNDPFASILFDVLQNIGIACKFDANFSRVILKEIDGININQINDLEVFSEVIKVWKEFYAVIRKIFTDGNFDANKRPILADAELIKSRFSQFQESHVANYLSPKSLRFLSHLSQILRNAPDLSQGKVYEKNLFYKGINGVLGLNFDHENEKIQLLLAPRVPVVGGRHWSATSGEYYVFKGKNGNGINENFANALLPKLKRIIELL